MPPCCSLPGARGVASPIVPASGSPGRNESLDPFFLTCSSQGGARNGAIRMISSALRQRGLRSPTPSRTRSATPARILASRHPLKRVSTAISCSSRRHVASAASCSGRPAGSGAGLVHHRMGGFQHDRRVARHLPLAAAVAGERAGHIGELPARREQPYRWASRSPSSSGWCRTPPIPSIASRRTLADQPEDVELASDHPLERRDGACGPRPRNARQPGRRRRRSRHRS